MERGAHTKHITRTAQHNTTQQTHVNTARPRIHSTTLTNTNWFDSVAGAICLHTCGVDVVARPFLQHSQLSQLPLCAPSSPPSRNLLMFSTLPTHHPRFHLSNSHLFITSPSFHLSNSHTFPSSKTLAHPFIFSCHHPRKISFSCYHLLISPSSHPLIFLTHYLLVF
jgi:hypothetical protein